MSGSVARRVEDPCVALAARIHDAALRCIARWGVAKTTLDDIAREAGCSRATIYRTFAGGKQALVSSLAVREVDRLRADVSAGLDQLETIEDVVVAVLTRTSRRLVRHQAFQFLLAHEPDVVLPVFAFDQLDQTLRWAGDVVAPALARFLPDREAVLAAEWVARLVVSYVLCPSGRVDLGDHRTARHFARTFVVPGLERFAGQTYPHSTLQSTTMSRP